MGNLMIVLFSLLWIGASSNFMIVLFSLLWFGASEQFHDCIIFPIMDRCKRAIS